MNPNSRLDRIRLKIDALKQKDHLLKTFGAAKHQYRLNPTKSENDLQLFENRFGIQLPTEYRCFLNKIGNGGAGPFYGLQPLENSLFQDLDHLDPDLLNNPSLEFQLSDAWNMEFSNWDEEGYDKEKEDEYFDPKWSNGLLRIANFGCGVFVNLVVNGSEYGNIWLDDRCNRQGIFPDKNPGQEGRVGFFDWYEYWLDSSLLKIG